MSPGFFLGIHWWRGIGPDREPDLFWWRFRFGFLTASVDRMSLYAAYQKLRSTIVKRVELDRIDGGERR